MTTTLEQARRAIRTREYFSAFPESPSPKVYGEFAAADGTAAFEAHFGHEFAVSTPGAIGSVSPELSPYGIQTGAAYPRMTEGGVDELVSAAWAGVGPWRDAGPERRASVCVKVLEALHARIFELANAVQHTSGQAFVMAFQAGGAHALDRALEAIAYSVEAQLFHPATATWTKPGRGGDTVLEKTFTVVPRGVALVIGCNTFPTWNSYPGLFASLAAGNPVIIKPHPQAILPLAITVDACQRELVDHGFDPHLVTLAAEREGDGLAKVLATHSKIKIVDYTGGSEFGDWLERNATQAAVFTEKSGVNAIVIDSCDDLDGMCANLAFTLSLYSGQMCTTSQNLFVPAAGIDSPVGKITPADLARRIGAAIDKLLGPDERAVELLGAIVSPAVQQRAERARDLGEVVIESRQITHPRFPEAIVRTPLMVGMSADSDAYESECFGPVSFMISTESTDQSLIKFRQTVVDYGAMTAGIYSTTEAVLQAAREVALDAGVALSENLTGQVFVNQSAAYSDFHGTGANPAANASYTDLAYVAGRFFVIQRRHLVQNRR